MIFTLLFSLNFARTDYKSEVLIKKNRKGRIAYKQVGHIEIVMGHALNCRLKLSQLAPANVLPMCAGSTVLAISTTIESMPLSLARQGLKWAGSAKRRPCCLAVQPGGIFASGRQQGRGRLRADTEASMKPKSGLFGQSSQLGIELAQIF